MALNATIYKAALQVANMDRHYYHDHALTLARHPSETDERLMVRVLAFARHASESLSLAQRDLELNCTIRDGEERVEVVREVMLQGKT